MLSLPFAGFADIVNGDFESGVFSTEWKKSALQNNKIPNTNHVINPKSIYDLNLGSFPTDTTLYPGAAPSDTTDLSVIVSGTAGTVQDALMSGYGATLRVPYDGTKSALLNLDPFGAKIARNSGADPLGGSTYTYFGTRGSSIKQRVTVTSADVDPSDGKVHIRFVFAPVLDNPGLLKQVAGTVTATNNSTAVVGVGTSFTSSVAAGNDIYFGTSSVPTFSEENELLRLGTRI